MGIEGDRGGKDRSKRALIVLPQPKEIGKGISTLGPRLALKTIEFQLFPKKCSVGGKKSGARQHLGSSWSKIDSPST
jgi:hypothetical protein